MSDIEILTIKFVRYSGKYMEFWFEERPDSDEFHRCCKAYMFHSLVDEDLGIHMLNEGVKGLKVEWKDTDARPIRVFKQEESTILLPDGEPAPAEMVEGKVDDGWYFREDPGMGFGNIDGEIVPLDAEATKQLRKHTFVELMGGSKCSHVQKDYEEIEEEFINRR